MLFRGGFGAIPPSDKRKGGDESSDFSPGSGESEEISEEDSDYEPDEMVTAAKRRARALKARGGRGGRATRGKKRRRNSDSSDESSGEEWGKPRKRKGASSTPRRRRKKADSDDDSDSDGSPRPKKKRGKSFF